MKNNYIVQAWLVLTLATGFAAALAGVQISLQDRIDQNKLDETYKQIPNLVPSADQAKTVELVTADEKIAYQARAADGSPVGWVIKAVGQGFADKIELLIGLDTKAERITGLYVLDQKETPGLGNKIADAPFLGNFPGKAASAPLIVVKGEPRENQVKAVTGATISSNSVCDIVNKAVAEFRREKPNLKPRIQAKE